MSKRGKFEEALSHLSKIRNVKTVSYKLNLKSLQLRLYYDAGLLEQAISAADSFRHFLQKESLMNPIYNEQYRNFYLFYIKLSGLNTGKRANAANELKESLLPVKNVIHKKNG